MILSGHVKNGVIVLDTPISLTEGTAVTVEIGGGPADSRAPTLLDRLKSVVGTAEGLPPDAAANVDHYLYGQPKS